MNRKPVKTVRPDAKGRIALGVLAKDVSSFVIIQGENNSLILMPFVEIPDREKWLFQNKNALVSLEAGLEDSVAGRTHDMGSFQQYLEEEID